MLARPVAQRHALAIAAASAAALLGLIAVASSLHGASKTALIGGIQMGGTYEYAAPPMMLAGQQQMPESWVGQAENGRPIIIQPNSGNYQFAPPHARAQRMRLAGQAQMPESWVGQGAQNQPVVVQPNSGNFQFRPQPSAKATDKKGLSKMQKLWMFNMGYEHHEQPPIYFGSARKENKVAESMAVAPTAAREMQLWGWPQQMMSQPHAIKKAHANKKAATQSKMSKMQKLWMFNMGYEHHEQPPIYFGSARKENNVAASM